MRLKLIFAAGAAALAASCSSNLNSQVLRDAPGYQAGYGDGCLTGTEDDKSFSTKQVRDAYAFDNDEAYRYGWRQGYLECSKQIAEPQDGGRILGERNEY